MEIQDRQDGMLPGSKTMHEDFPVQPAALMPTASSPELNPDAPSAPRWPAKQTAPEKTGAEALDAPPPASERATKARERADRYLAELIEEVGGLTAEDRAEARAWWNPTRSGPQAEEPEWAN